MSTILLATIKSMLDVYHDEDDVKLQAFLDGAERECLEFLDRKYLPTVNPPTLSEGASETESEQDPISESESISEASAEVVPTILMGVYLMVKAAYDNADAHPVRGALDLKAYRERSEELWTPWRRGQGV